MRQNHILYGKPTKQKKAALQKAKLSISVVETLHGLVLPATAKFLVVIILMDLYSSNIVRCGDQRNE